MIAFIGLITVILVSRYLGPEGRGQIGLFMSSVAFLQLFCDFGNSSAIINLSYKHSKRVLWLSSLIWIVFVCLLSFPILLSIDNLPFKWLIPFAALFYSIINLHHLLLMGNQEVHKRNISLLVVPIVLLFGFFVLSQTISINESNYIIALFFALLLSIGLSYSFVKKMLKHNNEIFVFESEILKKGFWVQSAQAVQFLNYRLNFFLVSFFIGNAALGIYNNAVILCEALWILGHSIAQMQHMKILNTHGADNHFSGTHKMAAYNFYGTTVLFLILFLLPVQFWTVLFGPEFYLIPQLFIVLSFGVIAFSISNIINHSLHAADQFKTILLCNSIGLVIGGSSALLLIPNYGIEGAALSWSIGLTASMLVYIIAYVLLNKKVVQWKPYLFSMIIAIIAASLLVYLSNYYMNHQMPNLYLYPIPKLPMLMSVFLISCFGVYFLFVTLFKKLIN
ncbi:MAG: polysaccharide biosynthesis C-terminal domain-containing protein [Bacteroidia bacterium]|nr:polysaccharide biosynthesis C-terminal domain-containing protein [Bacteroidia bacterium]